MREKNFLLLEISMISPLLKKYMFLLLPDGRVEGHALTSSCESKKPAVEQPLAGGCWNPPKKDTPHANTEKKPQQDGKREAVTIKSSPKSIGWVTHRWEKNNTKEILALL